MSAGRFDEERLFILRMVQEGKITADDAARLLEALDGGSKGSGEAGVNQADAASQKPPEEADPIARARQKAEELGRAARERADELGRIAREKADELRREVRARAEQLRSEKGALGPELGQRIAEDVEAGLRKGLGSLGNVTEWLRGFGWGGEVGPAFNLSREFEGEFGHLNGGPAAVELHTTNGAISVRPWDRPGYRVVAVQRVRGLNEAEAEQRAAEALEVQQEPGVLRIRAKEGRGMHIELQAWLPQHLAYDLQLRSTNGAVRASDLHTAQLEVATTNGAIHGQGLRGLRAHLHGVNGGLHLDRMAFAESRLETVNGGIHCDGAARETICKTVNGGIHVTARAAERQASGPDADETGDAVPGSTPSGEAERNRCRYQLTTSNGGIHLDLSEIRGAQVRVQGHTHHGRVRSDGGDLNLKILEARVGFQRFEATSDGVPGGPAVDVEVETTNGSIALRGPHAVQNPPGTAAAGA